ncbi:MerR family transcriptional regulator [Paenalcaligenes sp. Me131]
MYWKVGELAKMADVSVRTLHHYEHIGLLTPSGRSEGGYRLYDQQDVYRLMQILCLSQVGMPLADVQQVLAQYPDGILGHLKQHLKTLSERIEQMQVIRDRLQVVMHKIADNQQPTWLDWAVNPELITLYQKWCETDDFDTLALYESYLRQSAVWQKQTASFAQLQSAGASDELLQAQAWDIRANFEELTDFNLYCYAQVWGEGVQTSFATVSTKTLNDIAWCWEQLHLQQWCSMLPDEAGTVLQHTHHQAIVAWPSIVALLDALDKQSVEPLQAYTNMEQWLSALSLANVQHEKQLMICFLTEPALNKGLCLNDARRKQWQAWLCHVLTRSEVAKGRK